MLRVEGHGDAHRKANEELQSWRDVASSCAEYARASTLLVNEQKGHDLQQHAVARGVGELITLSSPEVYATINGLLDEEDQIEAGQKVDVGSLRGLFRERIRELPGFYSPLDGLYSPDKDRYFGALSSYLAGMRVDVFRTLLPEVALGEADTMVSYLGKGQLTGKITAVNLDIFDGGAIQAKPSLVSRPKETAYLVDRRGWTVHGTIE